MLKSNTFRSIVLASAALMASATQASEPVLRYNGPQVLSARPGMGFGASESGTMRRLPLGVGKSVVIDLPRDAKDVVIANPAIANALVRSARKAFIVGVAAGQTSVYFLDEAGNQIMSYDVEVGRDLNQIRHVMRQIIGNSTVNAEMVGNSVMLSGSVASAQEAQQIVDAITRLGIPPEGIINGLTIRGRDQVHLKVTVAEIERTALKRLGINFNGVTADGSTTLNLISKAINLQANYPELKALEENKLMRTLAEPTLTAISGEQAKFLAGGEFPIPTGRDMYGNITVEYKPYGVGLGFTPIVMSEGRISLKVATEVSDILGSGSAPTLSVRRADTTVELPSGGTIVIAGMLREKSSASIKGTPALQNLPVLGALFRSREYNNNQSELVVMVTPYLVKPVARNDLARPDDNYADASEPSAFLLGRINRIYGTQPGQGSGKKFHGTFGFIRD